MKTEQEILETLHPPDINFLDVLAEAHQVTRFDMMEMLASVAQQKLRTMSNDDAYKYIEHVASECLRSLANGGNVSEEEQRQGAAMLLENLAIRILDAFAQTTEQEFTD